MLLEKVVSLFNDPVVPDCLQTALQTVNIVYQLQFSRIMLLLFLQHLIFQRLTLLVYGNLMACFLY